MVSGTGSGSQGVWLCSSLCTPPPALCTPEIKALSDAHLHLHFGGDSWEGGR